MRDNIKTAIRHLTYARNCFSEENKDVGMIHVLNCLSDIIWALQKTRVDIQSLQGDENNGD